MFLSLAAGISTLGIENLVQFAYQQELLRYREGEGDLGPEDFDFSLDSSPRTSMVFQEVVDAIGLKAPTLAVETPRRLSERLRQTAWYISGVTSTRILERVRALLVRARIEGRGKQEFIQDVRALTQRDAFHIETVFRTNVASATGAARWSQYTSPEGRALFYGYRYWAKQDHRARELHKRMNGFIASTSDDVWKIIWIPNGYNCRCAIRPLRRHQALNAGLINEAGSTINPRIYSNEKQKSVVQMALDGSYTFVGKEQTYFPDQGFRGNALMHLVA